MKKILTNLFLIYIKNISFLQLKKINPVIIGVGGANGKSSIIHITNTILEKRFKVKQSKGKNSETGIPLNILEIEINDFSYLSWLKVAIFAPLKLIFDWRKYDIYLVEMGIDSPKSPKNMGYLLSFIKPDIATLTNIQIEHTKFFDDEVNSENEKERKKALIQELAAQEKLLLTKLKSDNRAIINLDDENIKNILPLSAKTLTISRKDQKADFYIEKTSSGLNNFDIKFRFLKEKYEISINQVLPDYYSYTIIASIAISFFNDISVKDSIDILQNKFSLPPGRFSVFKGKKNATLFDSSYNSSLDSSVGALNVLGGIQGKERKIAIFGDMNELGSIAKLQHELLAKEIIKNCDYAAVIGENMHKYAVPIFEKENFNFDYFENYHKARNNLLEKINQNDFVLIKASQNSLLFERIVEDLLADKKDIGKLCRRGMYWDNVRKSSA